MKKEKRKKIYQFFKRIFFITFIGFTVLYFSQATGYYEYKIHDKVTLTDEEIKKFEQDIKDGKDIDVEEYVKDDLPKYDNDLSNLGLNISKKLSKSITDLINQVFKYLGDVAKESE